MNNNFEEIYQKYDTFYEDTTKAKRKIKIISNILIALCIFISLIAMYKYDFEKDSVEICFYTCVAVLLVIYAKRDMMIRKLNNDYKQTIIPNLLSFINQDFTYNADSGYTKDEFIKTELYDGSMDKYYSSDLMEGSIGKTHMKISYVVVSEKQKTGKTTMYIPVFTGTIATFDFNKYFSGKTKIYTNNFFSKIEGALTFDDTYEKITLENQDFNDAFTVYTTDIQQAFYILSPSLVENIINIQSFDNVSRNISISFIDNKMYIAFEDIKFLDMDKTEDFKQQIDLFYNEINHLINIVEILELNNRIWTKQ